MKSLREIFGYHRYCSYIHHVVKVNNKNKGYEKYRNKKMEARVS